VHSGPPTSLYAQHHFRPISRPNEPPAPQPPTARARRPLPGGAAPASRSRHRRHPPLALWLASKGQSPRAPVMAAIATCPAASRRIRAVHVPRATAAISSRRHHPWLSPTLAARWDPVPFHLPAAGGEGEGEEKEELGGAPGTAPPAAKPEPPARRSRTCGSHARLRPLLPRLPLRRAVLLPLPAPPPSSSQRRAPLHRRLHISQRPSR
jgi:hypothetical protein